MAKETVILVGEGGSEFEFDLPLSPQFAAQVDAGQLRAVDGDAETAVAITEPEVEPDTGETEETPVSEDPDATDDDPDGEDEGEAPEGSDAGDPPPKVGAGSGTEAWAEYAQKLGIDTEGKKRADLIAAVEAL